VHEHADGDVPAEDAIFKASRTRSVRRWPGICQPTIILECTSSTNATYSQTSQVDTGDVGEKLVGAVGYELSGHQVRGASGGGIGNGREASFPRCTPWRPRAVMFRSTLQRATTIPSRRRVSHTRRAP
jgi:hypothetical protein